MRVFILSIPVLTGMMLMAAEQNPGPKSKQTAAKATKPAAPGSASLKLPAGAKEIETGLWRHVDEKGKTWHYRQSPFGLVKFEPEAAADTAAPQDSGITARLLGDTVELERKTPFGVRKWTKKKTELDEDEKAAVERAAKTASKE